MLMSLREAGTIAVILLTLCSLRLYASEDTVQRNDPAQAGNPEALWKYLQILRGEHRGPFSDPKVVVPDSDLLSKVVAIKEVMKEGRTSKDKGPQTIEEADQYLRRHVNMAHFPSRCLEHDGVFYFSGGTSAGPIEDFSSGFAIRKGESKIYKWDASDKEEVDG